jgi:flagellar hook assembly protein FlgD
VKIFGVDGRLIRTLADGEAGAGLHELFWDGCDDAGRRAGAGVYFCRLSAPGVEESRRMILLP